MPRYVLRPYIDQYHIIIKQWFIELDFIIAWLYCCFQQPSSALAQAKSGLGAVTPPVGGSNGAPSLPPKISTGNKVNTAPPQVKIEPPKGGGGRILGALPNSSPFRTPSPKFEMGDPVDTPKNPLKCHLHPKFGGRCAPHTQAPTGGEWGRGVKGGVLGE